MPNPEQQNGQRDTAANLAPMGPNKIQQALEDYDHMAAELAATKRSLAEYVEIANALSAERDVLKAEIERVTVHRDRLNSALQGYLVRYRVIRQTIEAAETEALEQGLMQDKLPERQRQQPGPAIGALPRNELLK